MPGISKKEHELIRKCMEGDKRSWDLFVDRYAGLIYYTVNKTLRNAGAHVGSDDINDLTHTVFLQLHENNYKKLRQFQGACSLPSWIRLISTRITIDYLRKQRDSFSLDGESEAERKVASLLIDNAPSAHEEMEQKERKRILEEISAKLTPRERLFVTLYYQKELPASEVAKILNATKGAVYTMKNRIQEKLRSLIGDSL